MIKMFVIYAGNSNNFSTNQNGLKIIGKGKSKPDQMTV